MYRRKQYFVAALTALMIVGFMATSLTSYFVAHDSLSTQISEQMLPLTSDNIYSEIQRDLLRPVLISSLMAADTFVRDWVLQGETDTQKIQSYLSQIQREYNAITAFFVSDATLNYYHPDGIIKTVSDTDPDDAWYFRVRNMREAYEVNVDTDTADRSRLSIFINYRVNDHTGNYIGATGVGLSVESVTRLIENYQQRYGRTIYFVDRQGHPTLTGSAGQQFSRLQDRDGLGQQAIRILATPSASISYTDALGETVYLNSRLVPEFDWYLLVEQQGSAGEARIQNTLLLNLGLSLGIMILVLLAAHFTLQSYQRRLEEMASTDKLTGASNRHMFETIFEHVIRVASRRERPVSLVSMDIDHFKKVNDNYGHQAGDMVLQAVADTIRRHIRESDTLCRWGGEEFILLLDDCPLAEAVKRVEKITMAVQSQAVQFGRDQICVTLSCGITQYRNKEDLSVLISRVDAELYRAKKLGRNQTCVTASDPVDQRT